ncbi:hypothetical protein ACQ4M3_02135 [Leptolyngbya sp. AN03gr2]|uniref:hypothetical protein n=1 Tax=unclassified Leptolyngbya TaxID=2650499 RepID=UPI003D323A0A
MLPPLAPYQVSRTSLICCIASSVVTHFLVIGFVTGNLFAIFFAPVVSVLVILAITVAIASIKALVVAVLAGSLRSDQLRWCLILGGTLLLSLLEAAIYYYTWNLSFPFG